MSESEFAAAIQPQSAGSSTMGVMKSAVKQIARSVEYLQHGRIIERFHPHQQAWIDDRLEALNDSGKVART